VFADKLGCGGYRRLNGSAFKETMRRYRDRQVKKVSSLPIDVRLNTVADQKLVEEIKPDVLIAAVGSKPFSPSIPGMDGEHVVNAADIRKDTNIGHRVVILGGGLTGCETAIHLANEGHEATVLEQLPEVAMGCGRMHKIGIAEILENNPAINASTGMTCTVVSKSGVTAVDSDGKETHFPCDSIVVALGMRAESEEIERLRPLVREFYAIGDALRARTIMMAVRDGYDAVVDMSI
jgi:2-enoate reductase